MSMMHLLLTSQMIIILSLVSSFKQDSVVNVRGHSFVAVNNHTPSNCDVCNKTLPWSLIRGGETTYECKRTYVFVWGGGDRYVDL